MSMGPRRPTYFFIKMLAPKSYLDKLLNLHSFFEIINKIKNNVIYSKITKKIVSKTNNTHVRMFNISQITKLSTFQRESIIAKFLIFQSFQTCHISQNNKIPSYQHFKYFQVFRFTNFKFSNMFHRVHCSIKAHEKNCLKHAFTNM
jgi:hypothetical protein